MLSVARCRSFVPIPKTAVGIYSSLIGNCRCTHVPLDLPCLYYFPTYDFAPVYLPPHASTPIYAVYAPQAFPTRRSLSRDAHVHLTTLLRPLAADRFLPYPCAAHSVLALPLFSYSFL